MHVFTISYFKLQVCHSKIVILKADKFVKSETFLGKTLNAIVALNGQEGQIRLEFDKVILKGQRVQIFRK